MRASTFMAVFRTRDADHRSAVGVSHLRVGPRRQGVMSVALSPPPDQSTPVASDPLRPMNSPSRGRGFGGPARKRRLGFVLLLPACAFMLMAFLSASGEERGQLRPVAVGSARSLMAQALHPNDAFWSRNATQDSELLGGLLSDWVQEDISREAAAAAAQPRRQQVPKAGMSSRWQQLAQRHHGNRWQQFVQRQQQMAEEAGEVLCAVNIPKVALLFLTPGPMPHERLWADWLEGAVGRVPLSTLWGARGICLRSCLPGGRQCRDIKCGAQAACHRLCRRELAAKLNLPAPTAAPVLRRQLLFSLYVHAPPAVRYYPGSSLFAGTLIDKRVNVAWGAHSLVLAERRLLKAAAHDPANAWFMLLSEASVPLYPPALLWQQLAHEGGRSRINACGSQKGYDHMQQRMASGMETAMFKQQHWRKSGQWFVLSRRHVDLALADREVHLSFLQHCRVGEDWYTRRFRDCLPSEHLYPSLLAALGEEGNTTCDDSGGTFADWSRGGNQPRAFQPEEVSEGLFKDMRGSKKVCGGGATADAPDAAARSFLMAADVLAAVSADGGKGECQLFMDRLPGGNASAGARGGSSEHAADPYAPFKLPEQCDLVATVFPAASAAAVGRVLRDCSLGLAVLPCPPPGNPEATAAAAAAGAAGSAADAVAATAAGGAPEADLGVGDDSGADLGVGDDPEADRGVGDDPGAGLGVGDDPGADLGVGDDPGADLGVGDDPGADLGDGDGPGADLGSGGDGSGAAGAAAVASGEERQLRRPEGRRRDLGPAATRLLERMGWRRGREPQSLSKSPGSS